MLYFRYKLKDNSLNRDLTQRSLSGIILYKSRWRYVDRELTELEPFIHLVEKQGPYTKEDFHSHDEETKKEKIESVRKRGQEILKKQNENGVGETVLESEPEEPETTLDDYGNLKLKRKDRLIEIAKELGFTDSELEGLVKADIIELIEFEIENRINPE